MEYNKIQQATFKIEQAYRKSSTDLKRIHIRFKNIQDDYKMLDRELANVPKEFKVKVGQAAENFMKAVDVMEKFCKQIKQAKVDDEKRKEKE